LQGFGSTPAWVRYCNIWVNFSSNQKPILTDGLFVPFFYKS
jgi:hypothetical protein